MNKNTIRGIIAGAIVGAIAVCSIPAIAAGIEAVLNSVNISLNGKSIAKADQSYELQNGTKVPYSILYEGTTYLPIRKVSEILDIGIDWDNDTRTVLIEDKRSVGYDSWYGAPSFTSVTGVKEISSNATVHSSTHWFDVNSVTTEHKNAYIEKLEAAGFSRIKRGGVKPRFKVYSKDNIEVWLDLGLYTKMVYGITVMDTTRPLVSREYSYSGSNDDIPNFNSAFGFDKKTIGGINYTIGDMSVWACLPDYLSLLDVEGFEVTSLDSGYYGKCVTLKNGKSIVSIKFDGTEYSDIPSVAIDY